MYTGYPLVNKSPWPICVAAFSTLAAASIVLIIHYGGDHVWKLFLCFMGVGYSAYSWFGAVILEGRQGFHSSMVVRGLNVSMALFIMSEGAFFASFFWAFLHACWGTLSIELVFPPMGIQCIKPWGIPTLNCLLLIGSGLTVTYAHKAAYSLEYMWSPWNPDLVGGLRLTVGLGGTFLALQAYEYWWMPFSINDGVYGSCFFVITGFHGLHVMVGMVWLIVCLKRASRSHFQYRYRHLGLQLAIWYWHFVDVVWLLLFFVVYIIGSKWY